MSSLRKLALILTLLLALFGVFVGGLMTWHHDTQLYGTDDEKGELFGCQESTEVNCDIVNTSEYSEVAGVPIATLAIPFYFTVALMAGMALAGKPGFDRLLTVAGVVSFAYSMFLLYVSKTELGYVCAWCMRLYGVNLAIFLLSLIGGKQPMPTGASLGPSAGAYVTLLILSLIGEHVYRSTLSGGSVSGVASEGAKLTHDPKGDAPAMSFTVETEDKNTVTFSLDPNDAWTGNAHAKVAVVMFGDLECGYCKRSSAELAKLQATYGDRVLFVFKHYPMNPDCNAGVKTRKHKDACQAAKASVCAKEQGYFWPFHDLAYKNQHRLGAEYLHTYAVQAGADGSKFDACMATDDAMNQVRHDADVGATLNIHGTPRIYIDGKLYRSGTSAGAMAKAIEIALGATPADAAKAAAAMSKTDQGFEAPITPIPADVPATRALAYGDLKFSIDTFEDAIVAGKAVSAKHQVPAMRASWFDAKAACEAAGKHLCTEEQWVSACQGARAIDDNHNKQFADDEIEGTAYPYGDYHADGRCWDGHDGTAGPAPDPANPFRPVYTGELPGCATRDGVYDMTGNVEEWVGDSPETAVLLGGAYDTPEDHARCYRRNDTFGAGYASARSGFRCCSEP